MRPFIAALVGSSLLFSSSLGDSPQPKKDDARALIEKAIKAHGGKENLAKQRSLYVKSKGVLFLQDRKATLALESWYQHPDLIRKSATIEAGREKYSGVRIFNGKKAWEQSDGNVKELAGAELDDFADEAYHKTVTLLFPLLEDKSFTLTGVGKDNVQGRPALGVKVSSKGRKDITLYFAEESGLLVKAASRVNADEKGKEIESASEFSDHKKIGDVLVPTQVRNFLDGKKVSEIEIVEVRASEKIDPKMFSKP